MFRRRARYWRRPCWRRCSRWPCTAWATGWSSSRSWRSSCPSASWGTRWWAFRGRCSATAAPLWTAASRTCTATTRTRNCCSGTWAWTAGPWPISTSGWRCSARAFAWPRTTWSSYAWWTNRCGRYRCTSRSSCAADSRSSPVTDEKRYRFKKNDSSTYPHSKRTRPTHDCNRQYITYYIGDVCRLRAIWASVKFLISHVEFPLFFSENTRSLCFRIRFAERPVLKISPMYARRYTIIGPSEYDVIRRYYRYCTLSLTFSVIILEERGQSHARRGVSRFFPRPSARVRWNAVSSNSVQVS